MSELPHLREATAGEMGFIYTTASRTQAEDNISTKHLVLSDRDRTIIEVVNYVFLCGFISLFGIVSNFINIVIFFKQGLRTTMNISFFGLAISDLCSLVSLALFSFFLNPLVENSDLPIISREFEYLVAGWPYVCFTRTTSLITAFVTAERCLCITCPLKVKRIITPRRAGAAVCATYVIMMLSVVPEYATTYMDWKFYPPRNATLLGLVFTSNRKSVEGLVFILNACLGALSYLLVVVFTAILIWKLKHNSKWRKTTSGDRTDWMLSRDRKAVSMVLLIASILIVCSAPSIVLSIAAYFEPEFSVLGLHSNVFFAMWSFAFFFGSINATVNIFLYYRMSSKYRKSFLELFSRFHSQPVSNSNEPIVDRPSSLKPAKRMGPGVADSNGATDRPRPTNWPADGDVLNPVWDGQHGVEVGRSSDSTNPYIVMSERPNSQLNTCKNQPL